MGDPDELDRLYGGDFTATGKLSFSASSDTELDNVPAVIRQCLAHHGYKHFRSDGNLYTYLHPRGYEVLIITGGTRLHWVHASNGTQTNPVSPQSGLSLIQYLDTYHS